MRYYCSESQNSKLIVERFIKMCESRELIYMAGPKGSEFMLLLKEYCDSFHADLDSVVNVQVDSLDESVLGDVVAMLHGRESPTIIAIDMRGNYSELTETILFRFLDNPAFSNARLFVLLDNLNPFEEDKVYSSAFIERAKESLFIMPPLCDRKADIAHFSVSLLQEYSMQEPAAAGIKFGPDCLELMLDYPWPGNFDELSRVIRVIAFSCSSTGVVSKERLEELLNLQRTSEVVL